MTPRLGDNFPKNYRAVHTRSVIKIGSVFKFYTRTTTPPKEKLFVIIAQDQQVAVLGLLYINSAINPNIFRTEELKKLHISLSRVGRAYLEHDSFLDCSKIESVSLERLKEIHSADSDSYMGELSEEDILRATSKIKEARTITAKDKKLFGFI